MKLYRRARAGVYVWIAALAIGSLPTCLAELVVLEDGGFLKVESYRVEDSQALLTLPGGGELRLPILRISRVVDDEIVRVADGPPGSPVQLAFADTQPVPATPYGELIFDVAREKELNPAVVAAVVRAESAFDPYAVSSKGARGLMQLMPATGLDLGVPVDELFEPERNLEAGTRYLRHLLTKYEDDLALALAAYNAGEGTVARYGGVPPYRETQGYIQRIYRFLGAEAAPSERQ